MKELNFEQMEIISAGLTQNQTCLIGGIAMAIGGFVSIEFAAGAALGALYYGCF